jgi:hypothetical protein
MKNYHTSHLVIDRSNHQKTSNFLRLHDEEVKNHELILSRNPLWARYRFLLLKHISYRILKPFALT